MFLDFLSCLSFKHPAFFPYFQSMDLVDRCFWVFSYQYRHGRLGSNVAFGLAELDRFAFDNRSHAGVAPGQTSNMIGYIQCEICNILTEILG